MTNLFCACLFKSYVDEPAATWSTVLEFIFSFFIGTCGVIVNYIFIAKLKEEKKSKPLDRKGNIIEPLMGFYCVFSIIYWPYNLLLLWIMFNGIIPSDYMNGWWCSVLLYTMKFGRMYIGYNSIFIAFIRYLYIVHQKKANQWKFAKVAKIFKISSIAVPFTLEIISSFTHPHGDQQIRPKFKECIASFYGVNSTENITTPDPLLVAWAMQYVYEWLIHSLNYMYNFISIVVLFNLMEGYLYLQIYRSINR